MDIPVQTQQTQGNKRTITPDHGTTSDKRTRSQRTPQKKADILDEYREFKKRGFSQADIAKELHIAPSTLSVIVSQEAKILRQVEQSVDSIRQREGNFPDIENALWTWCEHVIHNKGPLHDEVLVTHGLQIAKELGIPREEFKASPGWVYNFKKRHGLFEIVLHGESASVDQAGLSEERRRLQDIISLYHPDDVYNADETGLFYRMAPKRTLSNATRAGTTVQKERVSVLLGCNMSGWSTVLLFYFPF
jgi:transcriptional regulator with XRE-family HTH domain